MEYFQLKFKKNLTLLVSFIFYYKNHKTSYVSFFGLLEDDSFEIVSPKNTSSLLINTDNPIQHTTIIEKPVSTSIKIDKPPTVNEAKQSTENSSCLPIRYGSAAVIPYDHGFDLKAVLARKPSLPIQTNDLISILQNNKTKKPLSKDNNLQQILIDNDYNRQNLVQIAKQAQQDFIDAIHLD